MTGGAGLLSGRPLKQGIAALPDKWGGVWESLWRTRKWNRARSISGHCGAPGRIDLAGARDYAGKSGGLVADQDFANCRFDRPYAGVVGEKLLLAGGRLARRLGRLGIRE